MANDVQQGKSLGEFAVKQGVKTVAIVDDRTAYGQGLADEFRKAAEASGIKVVASEYTTDKATDFKAILTKIKSTKAELVFFGGMDAQGGPMAKQMKELGIKAKFLGGDGVCTPEFMKLGGPATEGQFWKSWPRARSSRINSLRSSMPKSSSTHRMSTMRSWSWPMR